MISPGLILFQDQKEKSKGAMKEKRIIKICGFGMNNGQCDGDGPHDPASKK